jgi:hypothetical protein
MRFHGVFALHIALRDEMTPAGRGAAVAPPPAATARWIHRWSVAAPYCGAGAVLSDDL